MKKLLFTILFPISLFFCNEIIGLDYESRFKFSGRIAKFDLRHSIFDKEAAPIGVLIAPKYVTAPGGEEVPQYAPTISDTNSGYNPGSDCLGYFTSSKYQANNNCYAYGTNIASNSFPQPGRATGCMPWLKDFTAFNVRTAAESDGLKYVGHTMEELQSYNPLSKGHFIALMVSLPEKNIGGDPEANWPGDYHWARCDALEPMSWSQKDGGDQVTNFDFAGQKITDPSKANWMVNQGPISSKDLKEYVVSYDFYCYMYVPDSGVSIL